jgi:hypothetical protein
MCFNQHKFNGFGITYVVIISIADHYHPTLTEEKMATIKYKEYKDSTSEVNKISSECRIYANIKVGSIACRFDHPCAGKVDLENKTVECNHPDIH